MMSHSDQYKRSEVLSDIVADIVVFLSPRLGGLSHKRKPFFHAIMAHLFGYSYS